MNKYIKQFLVVLLIAAVLLGLAAFLRTSGAGSTLSRTLKRDWQLELPEGYTIEYRAATDEKMKEGGLRYYVLFYEDSSVLDGWLPWQSSDLQTGYGIYAVDEVAKILDTLNVPGGERPELEEAGVCSYSRLAGEDEGELFLLHTEGDFRLYLVESIR